jgi:hypothetical protein
MSIRCGSDRPNRHNTNVSSGRGLSNEATSFGQSSRDPDAWTTGPARAPTRGPIGDHPEPSQLPPVTGNRCAYVARQVAVRTKCWLWATGPEQAATVRLLTGCPSQTLGAQGPGG